MTPLVRWLSIVAGIAIVVAAGWAAYTLISLFLSAEDPLRLGVLTAAVSVIALIYNNARQQVREIKSRHFVEKRQAYQKFFDFLFEMFSASRKGQRLDESQMVDKMQAIVKEIMIWGSAETINEFNSFVRATANPPAEGVPGIFGIVERLMRSLRRDLGHNDRKLEHLGLTKLLIKGDEHDKLVAEA